MFATDYPLLDLFWSFFIFFGFFLWIWVLVTVFTDVFRSRDLSGFAKGAWFVLVLLIPLLGALLYLIVRGHKMQQHAAQAAAEQEAAFRESVPSAAANGSTASQLTQLATLRDQGVITEDEFTKEKIKILR